MKNVIVFGGAGYVGAELIPSLIAEGYLVTVFDLFLYGSDVFDNHDNLRLIKADVRDQKAVSDALKGQQVVIHLACISNDPSFELDPDLGKSINLDSFEPLVVAARAAGVKRFIFASSSSVYGVKTESHVSEEMTLEPLTDYSRFKAECERILLSKQEDGFEVVVVRPATVCGFSRRQRLDVIVNILTNHAFFNKKIKVLGGGQLRPNIHIKDMVRAYLVIMSAEAKIVDGEIFNIGYENLSVDELAKAVASQFSVEIEIERISSDDNRSYHISSQKIKDKLGFIPEYDIEDAVRDLIQAMRNGILENTFESSKYYNIKLMQEINLV